MKQGKLLISKEGPIAIKAIQGEPGLAARQAAQRDSATANSRRASARRPPRRRPRYVQNQSSFSAARLSDSSIGVGIFFRCAARTAPWSWAISFSLRSGGVRSSIIGRSFFGLPPFVLLGIVFVLRSFSRGKNMPATDGSIKILVPRLTNVGTDSRKRQRLCCVRR
jgi:hypothetical protein